MLVDADVIFGVDDDGVVTVDVVSLLIVVDVDADDNDDSVVAVSVSVELAVVDIWVVLESL